MAGAGENSRPGRWEDVDVFEKALAGGWVLRKFAHVEIGAPPGKGCYWDEHELENIASGVHIRCREWEWADVDGERLVWASKGQLWSGLVGDTAVEKHC
jgi:hypothetical protein